jgi:hypothetical protein
MTAAAANYDRGVEGAKLARLPLKASQVPFMGSAMSTETTGYVKTLATKEPFKGFAREQVRSVDSPAADGDQLIELDGGIFLAKLPIAGVAQDDVRHCRRVYASDDNAFAMAGSGSYIGRVVGVASSGVAWVLCIPQEYQQSGPFCGFETLADQAATLTTAQLDKLLLITPGAGRTLTLPPAADCTGRTFTVKTLAAQVVTLDGDGTETIDGATTTVLMDAAQDTLTILSDGANWHIIAAKIA